jgi:hypothetical protein
MLSVVESGPMLPSMGETFSSRVRREQAGEKRPQCRRIGEGNQSVQSRVITIDQDPSVDCPTKTETQA